MAKALVSDFDVMTPLGDSIEEFTEGLFSGRSGISNLNGLYGSDFPVSAVGMIPGLNGKREPMSVAVHLVRKILSRQSDAFIDGVVFFMSQDDELSNSRSPISCDEQILLLQKEIFEHARYEIPRERIIVIREGCVAGLTGLAMAAQRIRAGRWRRALVLGVDLRCSPLDLLRFHVLGALSTRDASRASSPFSIERDGFVKSQAAGVFLLSDESSLKSGERIWGEIKGFGQTSDAWRLTEGRPDGSESRRAMEAALRMSGLVPCQIDCVSAHATGTRIGDAVEARTIRALWGSHADQLPVTALKSQLGHSLQTSGLSQVAAALLMLRHQRLAPTLHCESMDPMCALNLVAHEARAANLNHVLCNASGFGGQNACLILGNA